MFPKSTFVMLTLAMEWLYVMRMTDADTGPQYIRVCPHGWDMIGEECFYFSDMADEKNISEAAAHCESFKPPASLYTPYNETSINMIKQKFHTSDRLFHIGIKQTINTTTGAEEWYWGSGQLIPSDYWGPRQPDRDTSQPVLSMIRESGGIYFYDTREEDLRPFVCHQDVYIHCPDGYTFFNGRCFVLNTHSRNFDQAETECNKLPGGHLAAIRSADDLDFLKGLDPWVRYHWIWVGLTDRQQEGTWMLMDGTYLDERLTVFQNGGNRENCGMLTNGIFTSGYVLDDHDCSQRQSYICTASAQVTVTMEDVSIDTDYYRLLDYNPDTYINSEQALVNSGYLLLYMMTSPTPGGATISVTFNRKISCSKRPILFTWATKNTCKSLRSCRLITGRDVTSTSCLYRCPCHKEEKCHVVLLDTKKHYKKEPADICDVRSIK